MAEDLKEILQRLEAVEKLAQATADAVENLDAPAATGSKGLPVAHPLHPAKVGTPAYAEKKRALMAVLPTDKDYSKAQGELREAGIIS